MRYEVSKYFTGCVDMVCKKCGLESTVEGAVYCAGCGERLDGKIQCENCNQFNDGANAFCVYCGTRIDGKTVCKTCGELIDGAFCAKCGTAAGKTVKTEKKAKPTPPNKQGLWDKIFGLTSGGIALLGAVFALIFVFLIGFVAETTKISGSSATSATEKMNIYYFFGNAYKDIAEVKTTMADMSCADFYVSDAYVYTIICTILAAVTIACVVGFIIPAIISYVKYATGKTEKVNSKWALLTIFSFLGGVAALFAQNYTDVKTVLNSTTEKVTVGISGATVAGVVLCIIFAALWLGAKLASYGSQWKEKAFIKKAVCVLVSVCLLSALFAVWQYLTLGIEILTTTGNSSTSIIVTKNVVVSKFSPAYSNEYLVGLAEGMLEKGVLIKYEPNIIGYFVSNIILIFVGIAGTVSIVGCLQSRAATVEGKSYKGLIFSIILFALTAVALALFIVMNANANAIFKVAYIGASSTFEVNYGYGPCIAVMILAGLNLAVSITQTVFERQKME